MAIKSIIELKQNGTQDIINKLFPGLEVEADVGFAVAIQFDCDALPECYATPAEFLAIIIDMKKYIIGGPLIHAFTALETKQSITSAVCINYRNTTREIEYIDGVYLVY